MAKIIERKCRFCRSAGRKLFLKGERCFTKCPIDRKGAVPPGQRVLKRKRRFSDYSVRLQETQKLKRMFGISERQLKGYFQRARKVREATGEALLQILESRLDNVVYRLGFSPSRRFSRQLVTHKHILVDGKTVNIPSFLVQPNQVINLSGKAISLTGVKKKLEEKEYKLPSWLERKAAVGRLVKLPKKEEMETDIDEQLIVEYCSKR